jgi:hypothetical protein
MPMTDAEEEAEIAEQRVPDLEEMAFHTSPFASPVALMPVSPVALALGPILPQTTHHSASAAQRRKRFA